MGASGVPECHHSTGPRSKRPLAQQYHYGMEGRMDGPWTGVGTFAPGETNQNAAIKWSVRC